MALVNTANENEYDFKILKSVVDVNKRQVERFFNKIITHFNNDVNEKQFAVWGLSFKPNTDDVREAPALTLINKLIEKGASIKAYDPEAIESTRAVLGDKITYCEHSYDALENSNALIIVTEWNEFRNPDFKKIKSLLKDPIIFDGRNVYDIEKMDGISFNYYSVGRSAIVK
jgi:UDPglucose 6-dehydrogenase